MHSENLPAERGKWKPARGIFEQDGNRLAPLSGRQAEVVYRLATRGRLTAADCAPGLRLSAIIFRLRYQRGLRIKTDLETNRRGDGQFAIYRPLGNLSVIEYEAGRTS